MAVRIAWAYGPTGALVHVTTVPRGLSCGCRCTNCNSALEAINSHGGGVLSPHFRHYEVPEEGACSQHTGFLVVRELLGESKTFQVPEFRGAITKERGFLAQVKNVHFRNTHEAMMTFNDGKNLVVRLVEGPTRREPMPEDTPAAVLELRVDDPFLASMDREAILDALSTGHIQSTWRRHWIKPAESMSEVVSAATAREAARSAVPKTTGTEYWVDAVTPLERAAPAVRRYRLIWPRTNWQEMLELADVAKRERRTLSEALDELEARYRGTAGRDTIIVFLKTAGLIRSLVPPPDNAAPGACSMRGGSDDFPPDDDDDE